MIKFEIGNSYYVKKDGKYYLEFKCTGIDSNSARFMLIKINTSSELGTCPVLFSMLWDYFVNFYGKTVQLSTIPASQSDEERQVAFSNCENELWIDSKNLVL